MTDAPVITPTSPASTPYCGNNTIDGNEQCDGNDMPVGKNRTNGYSCDPNCQLTIIPSNIPTGTGSCGDGNINNSLHGGVLTAEDCDFGTNPITTWTNGTLGRSCGFPTIPDPASFTGGTLENPKACKFEGCGDGVVDAGESCDFGSAGNNGTTASGGVACSPQCKVVNLQCGNGRIDAGESCDFGSKNNTSYAENGFSCDNSCQYVATANTCSAPSTNLEGPKSAFLYFRSDHLNLGYKIYSVDSSNNWSINDVKLPTAPNELLSYGLDTAGVGKHSEKSSSELQVGKTAIDNFTMSAKTTKAFSRKQSLFDFIIGGRVQRLVDKTNRVDSLSFNLGDVLMG